MTEIRAPYYDETVLGPLSLTDRIIAFEQGELDEGATLRLFSDLVKTGLAWQLQGCYGRTARDLILSGVLSRTGDIMREPKYWEA